MDLHFLVVGVIIGSIIDILLQFEWVQNTKFLASKKKDTGSIIQIVALCIHCATYATVVYVSMILILLRDFNPFIWMVLFISHLAIDAGGITDIIMDAKGYGNLNSLTDKDKIKYEIRYEQVDSSLHNIILLILAMYV